MRPLRPMSSGSLPGSAVRFSASPSPIINSSKPAICFSKLIQFLTRTRWIGRRRKKSKRRRLLNRLLPLLAVNAATKEQVDEAQAADKSAKAALSTAQYDLEGCRVVAPFDGYITNLNISNGAYAHAAGEVITMVDVRNWYVIANFRESALRHIEPGMRADVFLMTKPQCQISRSRPGHWAGRGAGGIAPALGPARRETGIELGAAGAALSRPNPARRRANRRWR